MSPESLPRLNAVQRGDYGEPPSPGQKNQYSGNKNMLRAAALRGQPGLGVQRTKHPATKEERQADDVE